MGDEAVKSRITTPVQRLRQLSRIASTPVAASQSLAKDEVNDTSPFALAPLLEGSVAEKSTVYWDLSNASDSDDVIDSSKRLSAKSKILPSVIADSDTDSFSLSTCTSNNSSSNGISANVGTSSVAPSSTYHISATTPNLAMVAASSVYKGDMSPLMCEDSLTGRAAPRLLARSLSTAKRENGNILSSHVHGGLITDNNQSARDGLISRAGERIAELSNRLQDINSGTGTGIGTQDGVETGTGIGAGTGTGAGSAAATDSGTGLLAVAIMKEMLDEIVQAWAMPVVGREIAGKMSSDLLECGALRIVVSSLNSSDRAVKIAAAQLLSQCLVPTVRTVLANECLEVVVDLALTSMSDTPIFLASLCMLEHLMKVADIHCFRACQLNALKPILHGCSLADVPTLRHCAMALANLALFGGPLCHMEMARRHVPEWLFPLAFSGDSIVKYFALFAISTMVSNGEVMWNS